MLTDRQLGFCCHSCAMSFCFTCTGTRELSPGHSMGPDRGRSVGRGRAHTAALWSDTRHWWQRETSTDDKTHRDTQDSLKLNLRVQKDIRTCSKHFVLYFSSMLWHHGIHVSFNNILWPLLECLLWTHWNPGKLTSLGSVVCTSGGSSSWGGHLEEEQRQRFKGSLWKQRTHP